MANVGGFWTATVGVAAMALACSGTAPPDAVGRGVASTASPAATGGSRTAPPTAPITARPVPRAEGWEELPPSPLSRRADALTAWTGRELLVWGGRGSLSDACAVDVTTNVASCGESVRLDGAAFDPAAGRWRLLAPGPLPAGRGSEMEVSGVWTGRELVVLSLRQGATGGAAYDPEADRWRTIAPVPLLPRRGYAVAWTGSEVVVGGGGPIPAPPGTTYVLPPTGPPPPLTLGVAAWDPATDTWRNLPDLPVPRSGHQLEAVGRTLVLAGGMGSTPGKLTDEVLVLEDGAAAWRPGPPTPQILRHDFVVAGDRVIWLGYAYAYTRVAAFRPGDGEWQGLPDFPLVPRSDVGVVWTGRELVLLGGGSPVSGVPPDHPAGAALELGTGEWRVLDAGPLGIAQRNDMALAWTGTEVLAWGGRLNFGIGSRALADGVRYVPGR